MHRIRTQISWFIIALFISTLITTNFSIIPSVTAQTTQLFPDDISKILTANYTISQQLVHYSEGMFQGSGEVDCQFTNPTPNTDPGRIDIYANNQVFLWQRPVDNRCELFRSDLDHYKRNDPIYFTKPHIYCNN